ncbi:MAG: CcmD family protein [Cyclobacteriaceae bacterium]|jgi:K+-transporting ATPase A subunit|nr:CcmD family protein [Cyclobacteriaceae bacterium]
MKYMLTLVCLIASAVAQAQETVEMADKLRAEGKIYVIVVIILIVLAGLLTYLFMLDKKITKLEKEQADRTS